MKNYARRAAVWGALMLLALLTASAGARGSSVIFTGTTTVARITAPNMTLTDSALGTVSGGLTLTMTFARQTIVCDGTRRVVGAVTGAAWTVSSPPSGFAMRAFGFGGTLWQLSTTCQLLVDGSFLYYIDNALFTAITPWIVVNYTTGLRQISWLLASGGGSLTNVISASIVSDIGSAGRLSSFGGPLSPAIGWRLA